MTEWLFFAGTRERLCPRREPRRVADAPPDRRWSTAAILLACFAAGCDSKLVVGSWTCPNSRDAGIDPLTAPLTAPWSTSFEGGMCDYTRAGGFCYTAGDASYELVTSPVHSGSRALAFRISTSSNGVAQARCVRQGQLPIAAYYGAWYYIESTASELDNWNLFFFQGGDGGPLHGLWDITITPDSDGLLNLSIYEHLRALRHHRTPTQPVPIGQWFHIQVYLERAADATGEFALYQDGKLLIGLQDLVTDDSSYARWYVGNLARSLTPPSSTIYVDDVSVSLQP